MTKKSQNTVNKNNGKLCPRFIHALMTENYAEAEALLKKLAKKNIIKKMRKIEREQDLF